ncbi:MAG: hypothetical protein J1E62_01920 [Lachnospiraceae bacterium]|nr:hypothetical protein [Lachnospiraceae bacterium]
MQNYVTYISGGLLDAKNYYKGNVPNKRYASPLKELGEQTILSEEADSRNDSYRQWSKYDDRVDCYHSVYSLDTN